MSVEAQTWAWKQKCPTATKAVLLALADHADDEGIAWPGRKGLAKKVGITDRNITRHLSILEHAGIIVSVPRYRPDGSRTSNLYQLVMSTMTPPLVNIDEAPWINMSRPLDTIDQTGTPIEPSEEIPRRKKSSKKKEAPSVSQEFRDKMKEKYGAKLGDVDPIIDDALNHKASDRWKDTERGVDGWLRRQVSFNGSRPSGRPAPTPLRHEDYVRDADELDARRAQQ